MKATTIDEIKKTSQVIIIMAMVARIIVYVSLGLTVSAFIGSFLDDPVLMKVGDVSISLYNIADAEGLTMGAFRLELAGTGVQFILLIVMLYFVDRLFKTIVASESPFNPQVVRLMRITGVLLGVVFLVDGGYLGVVVAFIICAFAEIFKYGISLQQQADETI